MPIWKSIKGLFGQTIHYKDGVKVGETWDGLLPGTQNHYGADGGFVGSSAPGFLADEVHYNQNGERIGESWTDAFGTTRHYNDDGYAGVSFDGFTGKTSYIDDDVNTPFDPLSNDDHDFMNFDSFDGSD